MEAVWLNNFLVDKSLVSSMQMIVSMASGMIASKKEPSIHEIGNHIKLRNYLFGEIVKRGD